MKTLNKKVFALMLILLSLSFIACDEDENNNKTTTDPREAFLGTWTLSERVVGSSDNPLIYEVSIQNNPNNSSEIQISNLYLLGNDVLTNALITGSTITIENQQVCDYTYLEGSGKLESDNYITLNYTYTDNTDSFTLEAELTKE